MTSILNDPHLPTATALAILTTCLWCGCGVPQRPATEPRAAMDCAATYQPPSPEDEALLDDLQRRIVDYFWTEVFPETGIAIDHTENRVGKVAATGLGLAAICIGVERGWIPREEAYARVLKTLNAFWPDPDNPDDICVDGHFGLFWHFVDGHTGRMKPVDCVAICDSADFIAGVIVAGEYFKGTEIETLAKKIYDRVEWDQFVSRNPDGAPGLMSFGWVPLHVSENYYETDGLLNFNMSGFADNSLLIYPLALGSETHPIPQETWEQYVNTYTLDEYEGHECVFAGQLFSRQVPAAFIPFSRKRDRKIDYFLDTVNAILADRAFNMKENRYPPQLWGLTDAFGKDSYVHSAPPGPIANNGTVGTTAFAGALPHVPALSLEAMHYVREKFGDRVYGKYGFSSTVNAQTGFVSPLYVGIELGPMIMLIENYRSGLIWNLFARSRVMKNFVERAGISGVVDDFELPSEAPPYALWNAEGAIVARSDDRPQHGRFCLAITAHGRRVHPARPTHGKRSPSIPLLEIPLPVDPRPGPDHLLDQHGRQRNHPSRREPYRGRRMDTPLFCTAAAFGDLADLRPDPCHASDRPAAGAGQYLAGAAALPKRTERRGSHQRRAGHAARIRRIALDRSGASRWRAHHAIPGFDRIRGRRREADRDPCRHGARRRGAPNDSGRSRSDLLNQDDGH